MKSFGVDPVFRKGSTVSDSSIARSPRLFQGYYNQTNTNIDIISYSGLPFGYHPNINGTVAVWFDVAMSEQRAHEVLHYLKDGFFLSGSEDGEPKTIQVQILTYNGNTQTFGYLKVDGAFKDDGRIEIVPTINIFNVDMYYPTVANENRLHLEIFFLVFLLLDIAMEMKQCVSHTCCTKSTTSTKRYTFQFNSLFAYWTDDFWNILDSTTIALLVTQVVQWTYFVTQVIPQFAPESSRWVYESLFTNARYLKLHQSVVYNETSSAVLLSEAEQLLLHPEIQLPIPFSITGLYNATNVTCTPVQSAIYGGYQYEHLFQLGWSDELSKIVQDFSDAEFIVSTRASLDILIIIIILCQVLRLLKVLDFQPKLALVTKTVLNAGWELFHFVIVFGMQTVAFSACAHVGKITVFMVVCYVCIVV